MSAVRLYVDEDASESAVIAGLRARGVDLLTTAEAGREGTADEQQLEFATQQDRVLYTLNVRDFARLHREYLASNRSHGGIIVIPEQRYSVGEKIRAVAAVVQANTAESLKDRIEFL
ncbi:MAG: DUF5615 family PIN-like protein [Pirellulaceae bacterium]|nr:DUF5615 family PIN-like protein [Pirellulaceae bacterium]